MLTERRRRRKKKLIEYNTLRHSAGRVKKTNNHMGDNNEQFRYTAGMWDSNGSLFHKKSLNMGPILYQNVPEHGFIFPKFSTFFGFLHGEHQKIVYISRKIPKTGYQFRPKITLKGGFTGASTLKRHNLVQTKSEYLYPPTEFKYMLNGKRYSSSFFSSSKSVSCSMINHQTMHFCHLPNLL